MHSYHGYFFIIITMASLAIATPENNTPAPASLHQVRNDIPLQKSNEDLSLILIKKYEETKDPEYLRCIIQAARVVQKEYTERIRFMKFFMGLGCATLLAAVWTYKFLTLQGPIKIFGPNFNSLTVHNNN